MILIVNEGRNKRGLDICFIRNNEEKLLDLADFALQEREKKKKKNRRRNNLQNTVETQENSTLCFHHLFYLTQLRP